MADVITKGSGLDEEELVLWRARDTDESEARAQLAHLYQPFARSIAAKLYQTRIDEQVPFDEYLQYANLGLLEALNRFDCERGLIFTTFATYRIKGSILNGLEKATEYRSQLAYLRQERKERIAQLINDDTETDSFDQMVDLTIKMALGFLLEDSNLAAGVSSSDLTENDQALVQLKHNLAAAIEGLPARERLIIQCHYYHQMKFDDLAQQMSITKGRVSQLHKRALALVREALAGEIWLDDYY
jgi:RNA polymerase sigma factor for flagellar operon FliA